MEEAIYIFGPSCCIFMYFTFWLYRKTHPTLIKPLTNKEKLATGISFLLFGFLISIIFMLTSDKNLYTFPIGFVVVVASVAFAHVVIVSFNK